jgi:hypothetical protein
MAKTTFTAVQETTRAHLVKNGPAMKWTRITSSHFGGFIGTQGLSTLYVTHHKGLSLVAGRHWEGGFVIVVNKDDKTLFRASSKTLKGAKIHCEWVATLNDAQREEWGNRLMAAHIFGC